VSEWIDLVCSWCCDQSDDDRPCSEDCERLSVRAARTRRIVGCVEAIAKAMKLRAQYAEERIPGDHRIAAVDRVIADYDRQIHEAVTAQQRDDGHDSEEAAA